MFQRKHSVPISASPPPPLTMQHMGCIAGRSCLADIASVGTIVEWRAAVESVLSSHCAGVSSVVLSPSMGCSRGCLLRSLFEMSSPGRGRFRWTPRSQPNLLFGPLLSLDMDSRVVGLCRTFYDATPALISLYVPPLRVWDAFVADLPVVEHRPAAEIFNVLVHDGLSPLEAFEAARRLVR